MDLSKITFTEIHEYRLNETLTENPRKKRFFEACGSIRKEIYEIIRKRLLTEFGDTVVVLFNSFVY